MIITRGFRDVLKIGRIGMPEMFDLIWDKAELFVWRRHRFEVGERAAADGSVVAPLEEAEVLAVGRALVDRGIEAAAGVFINSYRNPAHKRLAKTVLRKAFPQLLAATSCAVMREMKEYERTSTTVVNDYLLVAMRSYLSRLQARLGAVGMVVPVLVMTSKGGMLDFTLMAFGGNGGVHAPDLARQVGVRRVVVLPFQGSPARWTCSPPTSSTPRSPPSRGISTPWTRAISP